MDGAGFRREGNRILGLEISGRQCKSGGQESSGLEMEVWEL